jgi:hypothetical protein
MAIFGSVSPDAVRVRRYTVTVRSGGTSFLRRTER